MLPCVELDEVLPAPELRTTASAYGLIGAISSVADPIGRSYHPAVYPAGAADR